MIFEGDNTHLCQTLIKYQKIQRLERARFNHEESTGALLVLLLVC